MKFYFHLGIRRLAYVPNNPLLIMKLIVLILVVSLCQVNAASFAQKITLTEKNVSLEKVINEIRAQTGFDFIGDAKLIRNANPVTVIVKNASLEETLAACFSQTDIDYSIDNQIVALKRKNLDSDLSVITLLQQNDVKGKVVDQNGNPLRGASIKVIGTTLATQTNQDGEFVLSSVARDARLSISFVGYKPVELLAKANLGTIALQLEVADLSAVEVTVNTGYQTLSKERATGAFESVSVEQISRPSSSIAERLIGVVPGLQTTVKPDGSIALQIRGQSSLMADQQPLIVYDGFAIEGGFESINPNDVESITVLKDAAAASIWGAKSANGVIVITSKKASEGKARVSVSSHLKIANKLDLGYVNPVATSKEVLAYEQTGFNSDFYGGPWPPPSEADLAAQSQAIIFMNEVRLGRISASERDAALAHLGTLNNSQQIKNQLLQSPITQQYNINISGGSEKMANNLSLLFEDRKSYFKGNATDKFLINYSNNVKVTDWLEFDFSGMFQHEKAEDSGIDLSLIQSLQPYDMLMNSDGSLSDMSYLYYNSANLSNRVPLGKFPYADWSYNPISELQNRDLTKTDINSRFQAGLTFKVIEGLKFASKLQYEIFNWNGRDYYHEGSFAVRQFINETSSWNQSYDSAPTQNIPKGGILGQEKTSVKAYNFRNQLTFVRKFAERHNINLVAGTELSNRVIEYTKNPYAFGYNDETLTTGGLLNPANQAAMWNGYPLSYAEYFYPFSVNGTHEFKYDTDRFLSAYGNLAYTYNDKYTATGSYRTDASNLIAEDPKYRYSPFWSIGLGWQLNRESFLNDYQWLDRLNMRLTYGYNGNVDKSTSFLPLIDINATLNPNIQETTSSISSYGNPTLRWEKSSTVNFGLDFSFLNRKLHGAFDYYGKKSSDLIVEQSIPSVNGTEVQKFNNGEMTNRGFEIRLGTTLPISENDITWSGSVNYAYNKNKITKFYKTTYQMYDLYNGGTTSYVEGYNANTLWSLRYSGMLNVGTEASPYLLPSFWGPNGEKTTFQNWPIGDAREYESNEGTTIAPSTFGMINSFKFYDFNLSFIVTGKFGHVFRRQSFNYSPMAGGNTRVNNNYSDVLNSDPSEMMPIPEGDFRYYFWDRFFPYLNYLTESASHIRFQEISASYSVPQSKLSKLGLNSLSFFAQANNVGVILFNDYSEDPEYPLGTIKPQSTFIFGLKFNL